jgi:hypothetical protein
MTSVLRVQASTVGDSRAERTSIGHEIVRKTPAVKKDSVRNCTEMPLRTVPNAGSRP